jgi:hypothetical protein
VPHPIDQPLPLTVSVWEAQVFQRELLDPSFAGASSPPHLTRLRQAFSDATKGVGERVEACRVHEQPIARCGLECDSDGRTYEAVNVDGRWQSIETHRLTIQVTVADVITLAALLERPFRTLGVTERELRQLKVKLYRLLSLWNDLTTKDCEDEADPVVSSDAIPWIRRLWEIFRSHPPVE